MPQSHNSHTATQPDMRQTATTIRPRAALSLTLSLTLLLTWILASMSTVATSPITAAIGPHIQKRIVQGQPLPKRLPWLVSISDSNRRHFCGANLVAENLAVTAAHCFYGLNNTVNFMASANRYDLSKTSLQEGGVDYDIALVRVHEYFDPKTFSFDIAVMHLVPRPETRQNIQFLQYIPLAVTPANAPGPVVNGTTDASWFQQLKESAKNKINQNLRDIDINAAINDKLYAAGWGTDRVGVRKPTVVPHYVGMNMAIQSECARILGIQGTDNNTYVCALGDESKADTCQGDSGGPLYTDDNGKQALVGIVSFGIGCGTRRLNLIVLAEYPGVYTNPVAFYEFIFRPVSVLQAPTAAPLSPFVAIPQPAAINTPSVPVNNQQGSPAPTTAQPTTPSVPPTVAVPPVGVVPPSNQAAPLAGANSASPSINQAPIVQDPWTFLSPSQPA